MYRESWGKCSVNTRKQNNKLINFRRKFMKSCKLPIQAAPVERTIVGTPMANESGIDPSFGWGDVWNAVKTYGPTVAKGIASLL
jgi:hypothetical protein